MSRGVVVVGVGLSLGLSLIVAGCLVEPIDLNDRKCDEEHPCVDGYTCVEEVCEVDEEEDPGASG